MKKILLIILSMTLLFTGCSKGKNTPEPEQGTETLFKAGTYEGSAKGFADEIKLSVTVDDNSITEINIISSNETESIGEAAFKTLIEEVISKQSLEIDVVSGATYTTNGFVEAMKNALTPSTKDVNKLFVEVEKGEKQVVELDYDVVVVGSGVAGLTTANVALQGGSKVLVLEKMSIPGGASATAGGGTLVTGSDLQKSLNIEDSADLLYDDLMKNGRNSNDSNTLRMFVNSIPNAVNWANSPDGGNLKYSDELSKAPVYNAERIASPEGMGNGVINELVNKLKANNVELKLDTKATELIVENGAVIGVKAEGKTEDYIIKASSVVLATGGYGANSDLIPENVKVLPYAGAAGSTGDALEMTKTLNAATINMDKVNIQPHSIKLENGRGQHTFQACNFVYANTGAIIVSQDGVRFVKENDDAYIINQKMLQNEHSYLIMDEETYNKYIEIAVDSHNFTKEQAQEWINNNGSVDPVFVKSESLDDLATTLNMNTDNLKATVETYNGFVDGGEDTEFGRKVSSKLSENGPYYAVEMSLRYYATLGGLQVNENMQVMNVDGEPISGLFAAGEVIGGALGDIYAPGALFGFSLTTGYNAGIEAVKK